MKSQSMKIFLSIALSASTLYGGTYEPFAGEPGLLAGSGSWTGEEAQGAVQIMPGSLKHAVLPPGSGNRAKLPPTRSKVHAASRPLGAESDAPWFSLLVRIDNSKGMEEAKPFHFFRLSRDEKLPGPGLYLKPGASAGEILCGASKRSNPAKIAFASSGLKSGVPHLIVGHYDKSVTPHVLRIWLNPGADTQGASAAPKEDFSTAEGVDLPNAVNTLTIGGGNLCPGVLLDEIRIGNTWAEVLPKANASPAP
jgi:hypothetical protein